MNLRYLLDALTNGGKTALLTTAAGCFVLLIYSAAATGEIVYLPYDFIALAMFSVLLGGLRSVLTASSLGWFHGALVALLYGILLFIAKTILFPASTDVSAYAVFLVGLLLAGTAGGVTGVNLRFSRRARVRRRYLGL
jgi:putative membrane protein (TIGR04086 family)